MSEETTAPEKKKKGTAAPASSESPVKSIETWAKEKGTDPAFFAVAKAITPGWGVGRECDEATFNATLERARNLSIRP